MLIMTFAAKSVSSVPVGLTRVAIRGAAQLTGCVTSLVKALIHRRAVMRLSELDERGLKDIGLVRADVEGALASSWLNDPSAILAARSTSRSCVASARREAGLRQASLTQKAAPRIEAPARETVLPGGKSRSADPVACSA
jgi:uncharacterized protein YjiS (DUF1127 family)